MLSMMFCCFVVLLFCCFAVLLVLFTHHLLGLVFGKQWFIHHLLGLVFGKWWFIFMYKWQMTMISVLVCTSWLLHQYDDWHCNMQMTMTSVMLIAFGIDMTIVICVNYIVYSYLCPSSNDKDQSQPPMSELPSLETKHLIILIVDLLVYNTNQYVVLCKYNHGEFIQQLFYCLLV